MAEPETTSSMEQRAESGRAWSLVSVMLYVMNLLGLLLTPVVIVSANNWLLKPRFEEANAPLHWLMVWFLKWTYVSALIPFVLLVGVLTVFEFTVGNKKMTSALNLLVAVAEGALLAVWLVAIILSCFG